MTTSPGKIYWANSLFTEADRSYNAYCVGKLRAAGYDVFLPQEAAINEMSSPTSEDIFRVDTSEILRSKLLIACLDQETIDSGVACEVGIAYAFNIPIVSLYTDIRQHRQGRARMYKNLYVLGAIETFGSITTNLDQLMQVIPSLLNRPSRQTTAEDLERIAVRHYEGAPDIYRLSVKDLAGWYRPAWSPVDVVESWISDIRPRRILEMGCGTGELARHIIGRHRGINYVGFDKSQPMISAASGSFQADGCLFTSDPGEVISEAASDPFDLAVAVFTLHDHPRQEESVGMLSRCLREGGYVLLIDLSTQDLPRLLRHLRSGLARPLAIPDFRIDPERLAEISSAHDLEIETVELAMPKMRFPSPGDLDRYLSTFGIYEGMDLPLGLPPGEGSTWRPRIQDLLKTYPFPFDDQRVFIICALKKKRPSQAN